jgi:hypothetical protein
LVTRWGLVVGGGRVEIGKLRRGREKEFTSAA